MWFIVVVAKGWTLLPLRDLKAIKKIKIKSLLLLLLKIVQPFVIRAMYLGHTYEYETK